MVALKVSPVLLKLVLLVVCGKGQDCRMGVDKGIRTYASVTEELAVTVHMCRYLPLNSKRLIEI